MAQASAFPAFVSVDFDNSRNGFREFRTAAAEAGRDVRRQFEYDMGEIQRTIMKSLNRGIGMDGKLDLGTNEMRKAAQQAEITAQATREVARALEASARANDDNTASTRRQIQAAQAAANEAEQEARALNAKAATYERVQAEISRAGTQLQTFAGASRTAAASQGALRQASIGAGQQLQDIAISLYSGQRAGVVFAQQLPQLAFALSALEGSTSKTLGTVGRFGAFLSGPWGLAVGLGVGALATLTAGLFDNADAADTAEDAHKALEKRLSEMSSFFDLATGAVVRQNQALIANARLKRLDEIDSLAQSQKDRQAEIKRLVTSSDDVRFENAGSIADPLIRSIGRDTTIVDAIYKNRTDQKAISDALLEIVRGGGENAKTARRILDLRGEGISANLDIRKLSLEDESLRTGKLADELQKPKKAPRARTPKGRSAEQELRAAQAIEDASDRAADAVANLRSQFDAAPRDIDRAAKATRQLDEELKKLDRRAASGKLTDAEKAKDAETRRQIEEIKGKLIPEFLQRGFNERIKAGNEELQIHRKLLLGRDEEAEKLALTHDLMRQFGVDTEEQLATELKSLGITKEKLDLLYQQAEQNRENERILARMDRAVRTAPAQIRELERAYSTIEQSIAQLSNDARGALKDFAASIRQQVNEIIARRIADNLFGDLFARLEDQIRGKKPIDAATESYVASTVKATTALLDLTEAISSTASAFRGAANDNFSPLAKLTGGSKFGADGMPSGATLFGKNAGATSYLDEIVVYANNPKQTNVIDQLKMLNKTTRDGLGIDSPISKGIGGLLKNAAEGAFIGQTASSLIFGNKGSATGSAIGGALGKIAGEELGKVIGGTLGKFAGPVGAIAGGLLGSVVGGLFKKAPKGYSVITGGGDGGFSVTGNKAGVRNDLTTASGSVQQGLARLAEMLGGDVGNFRVSIGEYKGYYRVSGSGSSDVGSKKYPKRAGSDLLYDGQDAEAAVRAAIADAIRDGAILGISQAQQRLIAANKDLEVGVQKALDFQSVFDRLKEYKDPVGAALDTLDKEFNRLKKIFAEAGASAADYASLEELYGIERAKAIKEASDKVTASLRSLYDNLTIGDSGRSLRDRLSAAQTAYDPLKARVLAGDKTAYDDFAKAAQDLLDIRRQFSGSQTPYFNLLDEITRITKERIDAEANITSIAENRDSPFTSAGAQNDNGYTYAPVVDAIQQQTSILANAILQAGGVGGFGNGFQTVSFR